MKYLAFLFCFISTFAIAQNNSKLYVLKWQPTKQTSVSSSEEITRKLMSFDGSKYPDVKSLLPYFETVIPLENAASTDVKLENAEYIACSKNELPEKNIVNQLGSDFKITSRYSVLRKKSNLVVSILPLRLNKSTGVVEKLTKFQLSYIPKAKQNSKKTITRTYATSSVLSTGKWFKIKILTDGVYRLTYDQLTKIGISNPAKARVFGFAGMLPEDNSVFNYDDLTENTIINENNSIIFYARGPVTWDYDAQTNMFLHQLHHYSDASYYFLTSDYDSGINNSMMTLSSETGASNQNVTSYDFRAYQEVDSLNLIQSGRQWFWRNFDFNTQQNFNFDVPGLIAGSTIKIRTLVMARSSIESGFMVQVGNTNKYFDIPVVGFGYTDTYGAESEQSFTTLADNSNKISAVYTYNQPTPSSEGWLDYITVNTRCNLAFSGGQLQFRDMQSVGAANVTDFTISNTNSNIRVLDISDQVNPKIIQTAGTSTINFRLKTDQLREFVAFDGSVYLQPITTGSDVGLVANQNLHGLSRRDLVIVTPDVFLPQANDLAQFHRTNDNLLVEVVTTGQVYNEFSSGCKDASAIRNLMRMLYDRAATADDMPKYLLLFGDGTVDNKTETPNNPNFIPTYESDESLDPTSSYVTDDFYGLLDQNDILTGTDLDLGVGRFVVKTTAEAQTAVDKIKSYVSTTTYGDWRTQVTFIADDASNGQTFHMQEADQLATLVDTTYQWINEEKLYLDAYQQVSTPSGQFYPAVNQLFNDRVRQGALIINYTGHGNEQGLSAAHILGINEILNWDNKYKLFLMMTATCEFSRWDDYNRSTNSKLVSAGELVFLQPNGGAVALFSTTRLVYVEPNFDLNLQFYYCTFNPSYRLGDIMRFTKNQSGEGANKLNFSLLGDPALQLGFPRLKSVVTKINQSQIVYNNGLPVSKPDTIKSFTKVTVNGYVADASGNQINNFDGTVVPTIFDKKNSFNTLNNDGAGVLTFLQQNNVLYKGAASVKTGQFSFSFIVPKDIAYNYGFGKMSFYVSNSQNHCAGFFEDFIIGGTSSNPINDKQGPDIKLYLNNKNFANGGLTDQNPVVLAYVSDSSGINTTGNGIGHDISVVLDNQTNNTMFINDSYVADENTYKSGKIQYPLLNLTNGAHQLTLKVWDVCNNSSEATLDFVVAQSTDLMIDKLFNYPNPFTTNTSFYFMHNQAGSDMQVLIQIFTVSGRLIKTIETQINPTGYLSDPIAWNGLDDFGDKIGKGVYVYKVKVRNSAGQTAEKYNKLLILN